MNSVASELRLLHFWRVSKLALGKGLGHWLKTRPAGQPLAPETAVEASDEPVQVSPGVGALLRGGNNDLAGRTEEIATEAAGVRYWPQIRWILWSGDLLLIGLCILLVVSRRQPMGFLEGLLCVLAVCNGAALGIMAILGPEFCWRKTPKE